MKGVIRRNPHSQMKLLPTFAPPLMEEQTAALAAVRAEMAAPKPGVVLLHGVTGSGKTEVYLAAIQTALDAGRGAIALVPEIALTPQTMERFRGRFGETVAVLHSHLSDGERHDEWQRIAAGKARVVVGARSALFAPVRPLGLLVVDEEHEPAYKQDESPRYNARDVAVMRGRLEGCAVVLGSATPSLESYRNARAGKYRLAKMLKRVDRCVMPNVRVVDMRIETEKAGARASALAGSGRGHSPAPVAGRADHAVPEPPRLCHHRDVSPVRPCRNLRRLQCQNDLSQAVGADDVPCLRPNPAGARPVRQSGLPRAQHQDVRRRHAARRGGRPEDLPQGAHRPDGLRYHRGEGCPCEDSGPVPARRHRHPDRHPDDRQGLDFPNVTLVGVVLADLSLMMPDFRAAERTFQLLTQVAGRAGRGDVPGEVLIQTYAPFHPAVQSARNADYRHVLRPGDRDAPGDALSALHAPDHGPVQEQGSTAAVDAVSKEFAAQLKAQLPESVRLTGPAPAPLAKAKGFYRVQLMLWAVAAREYVPALRALIKGFKCPKGLTLSVNVDALSLM